MNQTRCIRFKALDGRTINWNDDPEAAKKALGDDGWLVLQGDSKVDDVRPELNQELRNLGESMVRSKGGLLGTPQGCLKRNILLNRAVGTILFTIAKNYAITSSKFYAALPGLGPAEITGTDAREGTVSFVATHLGGGAETAYEVQIGTPGGPKQLTAQGGDIFICRGDQKWTLPHITTPNHAFFCEIYYLRVVPKQYMTERILQEGGGEVTGRDVVWLGDRFNAGNEEFSG